MFIDIADQIKFFKNKKDFEALFDRLKMAEEIFYSFNDISTLFEKRYRYNTRYRWE